MPVDEPLQVGRCPVCYWEGVEGHCSRKNEAMGQSGNDVHQFTDSKDVNIHSCHLLLDQLTLIHGHIIPDSCAMLFFTTLDFTFTPRYIQLWIYLVVKVKSNALIKQYCLGTWNVRSMNQGKMDMVKQEMARVNIDILGISELKWTGMGQDSHSPVN